MRVLERIDCAGREVRIVERIHDGSRLYYDRGVLYTGVDAKGNNILAYVTAMQRALHGHRDVLLLGAAGGALAGELSRAGARITAVDIWSGAFVLARRWFHLPPEVVCVEADAATFLQTTQAQWSAIAVDVFDGLEIPKAILNDRFARALRRGLRPGGHVVWNVAAAAGERDTVRVLRLLGGAGLVTEVQPVFGDARLANTLVLARNPAEPEVTAP